MSEQTEERLQRLRSIPLFADLSEAAVRRILDSATEFEAEKGHVLVAPNQAATGLFVVEDGTVRVDLPGRKVELGPGEFFGDLALLDARATHTARVSAATRIRCLAIRREDFDELLTSEPTMAIVMVKVLARRLADSQ